MKTYTHTHIYTYIHLYEKKSKFQGTEKLSTAAFDYFHTSEEMHCLARRSFAGFKNVCEFRSQHIFEAKLIYHKSRKNYASSSLLGSTLQLSDWHE